MTALIDSTETLLGDREFFQKTLDCLQAHIAILEKDGTIITVNATWNKFASRNGLAKEFCGPGANYLSSCDNATGDCSEEAKIVADGIRDIIADKQKDFYLEYPCHSPTVQRWFSVRITRFEISGSTMIVVTHDDITQRKLAELELKELNRILDLSASTDGLTRIANRRSFDHTFEQEWKRHERMCLPLSVALLDVDCFKQFNDRYGHLSGDDCLVAVAQSLQEVVGRAGDFVARYGGEEFAIILPNTAAGAAVVLEEVLCSIRQLAIPHASSTVSRGVITASIGFATAFPEENITEADLLSRADHALYEAKAKGRDQVIYADADRFVASTFSL